MTINLLSQYTSSIPKQISAYFHIFIFGILFILVVLLLPGGLVEMAARVRKPIIGKKVVAGTP